jgi:hypothetical protein
MANGCDLNATVDDAVAFMFGVGAHATLGIRP